MPAFLYLLENKSLATWKTFYMKMKSIENAWYVPETFVSGHLNFRDLSPAVTPRTP